MHTSFPNRLVFYFDKSFTIDWSIIKLIHLHGSNDCTIVNRCCKMAFSSYAIAFSQKFDMNHIYNTFYRTFRLVLFRIVEFDCISNQQKNGKIVWNANRDRTVRQMMSHAQRPLCARSIFLYMFRSTTNKNTNKIPKRNTWKPYERQLHNHTEWKIFLICVYCYLIVACVIWISFGI